MDRFQRHFYTITIGTEHISGHFSTHDHNGINDVTIHILAFISFPNDSSAALSQQNKIELACIHRLCTQEPLGLNILD